MFTLARSISSWYLISKVSFSWYADFCFSSACKSLYRKNIHEFQISFLYADKLFIDKNIMTILFWPWMTTGPQWEIYKIIRFICIHHNLRVPPPPMNFWEAIEDQVLCVYILKKCPVYL